MLPGHETGVVPFAKDGGFDGQGGGEEEAAVAAGEGVAVNVGEVLVCELLGHFDTFGDVEVGTGVAA